MTNVSLGKKRFTRWAAAVTLAASIFGGPMSAFASTILPAQVLPPGTGRSCAPVTFSDVQAHVYNGNLDSFDITVSDPTYVAVSTSVDKNPIAFNYITRWANTDGSVRMHVDLQSIRMNRDVPIDITFLSVHSDESGGQVTCIFEVPATIKAVFGTGTGSAIPGQTPSTHIPHPSHPSPTPSSGTTGHNGQGTGTSATSSRNPGIVAAMSSLGNLCADGGASRLWVVLLVLFALFCFVLCAQRFEANTSVRDWNIGLILAVFVGLLIFWYVSAVCRTGAWAPAVATLITIIGLLYTMLKGDEVREILLLKDGKK